MMGPLDAAEAWAGNPDLETSANTFFAAPEIGSQSLTEFDRLVAQKELPDEL